MKLPENFAYTRNLFVRIFTLSLILLAVQPLYAQTTPDITPEEFSRMVVEMSEPGGYFPSDNWVTNEICYLEVLQPIKQHNISGGVYIGVAAAQNFSYIAKIKPQMAFFCDIRHLNRMQHLSFKILFELADNRIDFFSLLFSKPIDPDARPGKDIKIDELVYYFFERPSDPVLRDNTIGRIVEILETKYKFTLDERDKSEIREVMDAFYRYHLNIRYSINARMRFPTFAEVLTARDLEGNMSCAFNSNEDYEFIRDLQMKNRIIPVTGDVSKQHALRSIGDFIRQHGLTLSAYYVSNFEEYVIKRYRDWEGWIANVRNIPIDDKSVIIRWTHELGLYYQDTRLQFIKKFLELDEAGEYNYYTDLIYTEYVKYYDSRENR